MDTSVNKNKVSAVVRLFGVNIPSNKKVKVGLPILYGIGKSNVFKICDVLKIDPELRMYELSNDNLIALRRHIEDNFKIEGELRGQRNADIMNLIDINCHRGRMHKNGLPVRGQNTKNNARTRKGSKKKRSF